MGASRDFTSGYDTGVITAERPGYRSTPQISRSRLHTTLPDAPTKRGPRRSIPRTSRVGSQQVISYRGRRMTEIKKVTLFSRLSAIAIGMLITGLAIAMWLSGVATTQTFEIQRLTVQEQQLNNQLESLNRDLENVRSSADVARQASLTELGVPTAAGIVEVKENGDMSERRPAEEGLESIIDVNGAPVRPGQASSDPNETNDVSGNLTERPQGQEHAYRSGDDRNGAQSPATDNGHAEGDNRDGQQPNDAPQGESPAQPAPPAAPAPERPAQAPYAATGE